METLRQERNEAICLLRQQGMTLDSIGQMYGLTREMVRIITLQAGVTPLAIPESRVAKLLGYSVATLVRLRQAGKVNPRYQGHWFIYGPEVIEVAKQALLKHCKLCGVEVVPPDSKYCPLHSREVRRYKYPFMSDEQKRKHHERCRSWQGRNPERFKATQKRASEKQYIEHRDEIRAHSREYYANHKEECCARGREYYASHVEKLRARYRKYYAKNRETILAKQKEAHRLKKLKVIKRPEWVCMSQPAAGSEVLL